MPETISDDDVVNDESVQMVMMLEPTQPDHHGEMLEAVVVNTDDVQDSDRTLDDA